VNAGESERAARLVERLLTDRELRARFRRDPGGVSREAGVQAVADELTRGDARAMMTLDGRESRSSLAGMLMAAAVEGVGVYQFASHVLDSGPAAQPAAQVLSQVRLPAVHQAVRASASAAAPDADDLTGNLDDEDGGADEQDGSNEDEPDGDGGDPDAGDGGAEPAAGETDGDSESDDGDAESDDEDDDDDEDEPDEEEPDEEEPDEDEEDDDEDDEDDEDDDDEDDEDDEDEDDDQADAAPAAPPATPGDGAVAGEDDSGAGDDSAAADDDDVAQGDQADAGSPSGEAPDADDAPDAPDAPDAGAGPDPPPDPDQYGMAGGGGAVSAQARAVLADDRITLDANGREDFAKGRIDPRLGAILLKLAEKHKLTISATSSDHPQATAGGSVSNHWYGRAIDIAAVDGQPVSPSSPIGRALATEIAGLGSSIRPTEVGSPWAIQEAGWFTDADHQDHIHVAFDEPISRDWKPPGGPLPEAQSSAADATAPGDGVYPGDAGRPEERAAWMARAARERGLPAELPVMASLVESGLKNLSGGSEDSAGLFQMRESVWNQGDYAGYADHPERQLDWFLDRAEEVRRARVARGQPVDESSYGEWVADIERPREIYRGRYQLRLDEARELLRGLVQEPDAPAAPQHDAHNDVQVLPVLDRSLVRRRGG
jgi:hypothetical protein